MRPTGLKNTQDRMDVVSKKRADHEEAFIKAITTANPEAEV